MLRKQKVCDLHTSPSITGLMELGCFNKSDIYSRDGADKMYIYI
jgi:hypothetical protein